MSGCNPEESWEYTMKVPVDEAGNFCLRFRRAYRKEQFQSGMDGYQYAFNGRVYRDVESLQQETVEELSGNVQITRDIYGGKVLRTYTQIPTFDSGDREWDSKKLEFLFFDGKNIHLVVMRGGYRIASLTFYEELLAADCRMGHILEKLDWPVDGIVWI